MKDKTQKNIRVCSFIALVLCVLWVVFEVLYFVGLLTGKGGVSEEVEWSENNTIKVVFFILYFVSTALIISLCFKIVINVLKGIREQVVFPQSNVKPLFWIALIDFIYRLCWINQSVLLQDDFVFAFTSSNFITPFFLLFFAFMYKVAADAVEENNLTV